MKCSLGITNFLKETSNLSHSIVFFYFFVLITEESFLISPCYFLELCIQTVPFLLCLWFLLLSQPFCLFAFLFLGDGFDYCFLYNIMNLCSQFFRHSVGSNPLIDRVYIITVTTITKLPCDIKDQINSKLNFGDITCE